MATLHLPRRRPREQTPAVPVTQRPRRELTQISIRGRVRQGAKKALRWVTLTDLGLTQRQRIRELAQEIIDIIDQDR